MNDFRVVGAAVAVPLQLIRAVLYPYYNFSESRAAATKMNNPQLTFELSVMRLRSPSIDPRGDLPVLQLSIDSRSEQKRCATKTNGQERDATTNKENCMLIFYGTN